jgi:hypothetical protein
MKGQRPTVLAVTQHIKPEVYPKVEDEATILLTYPKTQGIIQAPELAVRSQRYGDLRAANVLVPRMNVLRVRKASTRSRNHCRAAEGLKPIRSYLAVVGRISTSGSRRCPSIL